MMMYYWIYEVKCKHVMLFEDIESWDTIVNYSNYFRLECRNWLHVQAVSCGLTGLAVGSVTTAR